MKSLHEQVKDKLDIVKRLSEEISLNSFGLNLNQTGDELDAAITGLLTLNRGMEAYCGLFKPYIQMYVICRLRKSPSEMRKWFLRSVTLVKQIEGKFSRSLAIWYYYFANVGASEGFKLTKDELKSFRLVIQKNLFFAKEDLPEGFHLDEATRMICQMEAKWSKKRKVPAVNE